MNVKPHFFHHIVNEVKNLAFFLSYRRLVAIVFGNLCLLCSASAGVTFSPHPNYPTPNFFSGTNARAFYSISLNGTTVHISDVELSANGTIMAYHHFDPIGLPPRVAYRVQDWIGAMFDSNMFPHLDNVEVKCRVKADGTWYEDSYSAQSLNQVFLAGLNYLEDVSAFPGIANYDYQGTLAAKEKLESFFSVVRDISQYTPEQYLLGQTMKTVHMYSGHANVFSLADGTHTGTITDRSYCGQPIFYNNADLPGKSVLHHKIGEMEGGLPPFSPRPALNITFLEACETTRPESNSHVYMFPYWNGYGRLFENQAVLGCATFMTVDTYRYVSEKVFGYLITGRTVDSSKSKMVTDAQDDGVTVIWVEGGQPRIPEQEDFKIKGNAFSTIKNVYTPDVTQSLLHFREIFLPNLD